MLDHLFMHNIAVNTKFSWSLRGKEPAQSFSMHAWVSNLDCKYLGEGLHFSVFCQTFTENHCCGKSLSANVRLRTQRDFAFSSHPLISYILKYCSLPIKRVAPSMTAVTCWVVVNSFTVAVL